MKDSKFVVPEFTNSSGEIVYRLYGRIDGQRIRKNFATHAEADAERQARELAGLSAQLAEPKNGSALSPPRPSYRLCGFPTCPRA